MTLLCKALLFLAAVAGGYAILMLTGGLLPDFGVSAAISVVARLGPR